MANTVKENEDKLLELSMFLDTTAAALDAALTHNAIEHITAGRMNTDEERHLFAAVDAAISGCETLLKSLQQWRNVGNAPRFATMLEKAGG